MTNKIICEFIDGTNNVKLLENFDIETKYGNFTVPKDFISDLASIPRIVWNVCAPFDPGIREAALIHDWLYRTKDARFSNGNSISRLMADEIFLDELRERGIGYCRRYEMYWVVRGFGASSWVE